MADSIPDLSPYILRSLDVCIDADLSPQRYVFVQQVSTGATVGMALVQLDEKHTLWLSNLFVRPEFQGQGLGSLLLRGIAGYGRATGRRWLSLSVSEKNPRARRLYERHGYTEFMVGQPGYTQMIKDLHSL